MKYILILLAILTGPFSFSQIYGDIAIDKRPIVKAIEYGVVSNYTGQIVLDIVVDEQGNVTVCKLNNSSSNASSTSSTELHFKICNASLSVITSLIFYRPSSQSVLYEIEGKLSAL